MSKLNSSELESLKNNPEYIKSAKLIADQITKDPTSGGVFPKGNEGNFDEVNHEMFKNKYCDWWPLIRILLIIAKIFTGKKGDKAINRTIEIGDEVC